MNALELFPHLLTTGRAGLCGDVIALDWTWAKAELAGCFASGPLCAELSLAYGEVADLLTVVDGDFDHAVKVTLTDSERAVFRLAELTAGEHRIALYKATQARSGGINLHALTFEGTLSAAPAPAPLRIQIVGDSISCGAGAVPIDRPEASADCAEYCYGALLSRMLPAEVTVTAVSGWGIACGGMNYDALLPKIFGKTNHFRDPETDWDFAQDDPDVVVVALGTNDYRFAGEGREAVLLAAAREFLATLRGHYPHARILWVYGQMLNQYNDMLREMVASFRDARMAYLDLPRNVAGGFGHPDAEGHAVYAERIATWIKSR